MCKPSNEPKFKMGDKAEFRNDGGIWMPVTIIAPALRWEFDSDSSVYLIQHDNDNCSQQRFLIEPDRLRPVERWERCPKKHRIAGMPGTTYDGVLERLVGGGEEEA